MIPFIVPLFLKTISGHYLFKTYIIGSKLHNRGGGRKCGSGEKARNGTRRKEAERRAA